MIKENIHIALESSLLIGFFSRILSKLINLRIFLLTNELIIFLKGQLKITYENSILYSLIKPKERKESEKDFYSESIAFKISEKTASRIYERTRKYPEGSRIIDMGRRLAEFLKNISSRNVGIIILTAVFINTFVDLIHNATMNAIGLFVRTIIILNGVLFYLNNSPFESLLKKSRFFRRVYHRTEK